MYINSSLGHGGGGVCVCVIRRILCLNTARPAFRVTCILRPPPQGGILRLAVFVYAAKGRLFIDAPFCFRRSSFSLATSDCFQKRV